MSGAHACDEVMFPLIAPPWAHLRWRASMRIFPVRLASRDAFHCRCNVTAGLRLAPYLAPYFAEARHATQ